jgi:DNA-binding transcriptional LysR family regulator
MAVHEVAAATDRMTLLREVPIGWVGSRSHPVAQDGPLPVALYDRACWWRDAALRSLENGARDYRVVLTSESSGGIIAAIRAGIAIGLLDCSDLPHDLVPLTAVAGLAPLPPSQLVLEIAADRPSPLAEAMAETVIRSYAGTFF